MWFPFLGERVLRRVSKRIRILVIDFCDFVSLSLIKIFPTLSHRTEQTEIVYDIDHNFRRDVGA